jgi:hypothetical protein
MSHPSEKCTPAVMIKHVAIISVVTACVIIVGKWIRK